MENAISYFEPSVEYGSVKGGVPRPTYLIKEDADQLSKSLFPKSNVRKFAEKLEIRWSLGQWLPMEGESGLIAVKVRHIHAAVFSSEAVVAYANLNQSKNTSGDDLDIDEFAAICDDESEELGGHALAVKSVLAQEHREWINPGEVTIHIKRLLVAPAFKGKKLWVAPITALLDQLAKPSRGYGCVCVMQAQPLELSWREGSLNKQHKSVGLREAALAARRRAALTALYEKTLGFSALADQWLAKTIRAAV